jgi:hypothetical protein
VVTYSRRDLLVNDEAELFCTSQDQVQIRPELSQSIESVYESNYIPFYSFNFIPYYVNPTFPASSTHCFALFDAQTVKLNKVEVGHVVPVLCNAQRHFAVSN